MTDIRSIGTKPNPMLVEQLKDLLASAESGEIQAMAVATLNSGGEFIVGWEAGTCPVLSLLGAAEMLKAEILINGMEW